MKGRINIVKAYIERGDCKEKIFFANIKDHESNSALMLASKNGHLDIVKFLLDNGADINSKNILNDTALIVAIKYKNYDIAELIIEKGIFLKNIKIASIEKFIGEAIKRGNLNILKYIFRDKKYIDTKDENGFTPLTFAVKYGRLDIVKYLLMHGANDFQNVRLGDLLFQNTLSLPYDIKVPICPIDRLHMVVKVSISGDNIGKYFFVCPVYPYCKINTSYDFYMQKTLQKKPEKLNPIMQGSCGNYPIGSHGWLTDNSRVRRNSGKWFSKK